MNDGTGEVRFVDDNENKLRWIWLELNIYYMCLKDSYSSCQEGCGHLIAV